MIREKKMKTVLKNTLLAAALSAAFLGTQAQAAGDTVQAGNNIAVVQTQAGRLQGFVQNGVAT